MKADNQHTDNDELLVKYLAGEANADERTMVGLWINANAENATYYNHFKTIWDESQKLAHKSVVNEDMAWNRFRDRIQKEYGDKPKPALNLQWLKVAAVILLVSAAALWVPYILTKKSDTRFTSIADGTKPPTILNSITIDNTKVDTLPDGSIITLNKNTSLQYPAKFEGRIRNVELKGEAFFRVKHIAGNPFVIKVNEVLITVLGTSFNVNSRNGNTIVIVETGIVSVTNKTSTVAVYPGERLIAIKAHDKLKKVQNRDTPYREYLYKQSAYVFKKNSEAKADSPFDINKHPDLLQKLLKDPKKWAQLLKRYSSRSDDIKIRRAIIRSVMDDIVSQNIMTRRRIISFRLNENEFIINDKHQSVEVQQRFVKKYIKEPGYTIYFGGTPKNGKGIYLSPDSL